GCQKRWERDVVLRIVCKSADDWIGWTKSTSDGASISPAPRHSPGGIASQDAYPSSSAGRIGFIYLLWRPSSRSGESDRLRDTFCRSPAEQFALLQVSTPSLGRSHWVKNRKAAKMPRNQKRSYTLFF